jgi:hypothetical protein
MLLLSETEPFARGGRRACYFHPADPGLCVKVALPGKEPEILRRQAPPWGRFRSRAVFDENMADSRFARRLQRRLGERAFKHIPRVHDFIETDLGPGLVFDLVRDADGRVSLSGKGFIVENGITAAVREALEKLKRFFLENRILIRDPFPHNFAFRKNADGGVKIYAIDGFGSGTFLPLVSLFPPAGRRYTEKKFRRLEKGMERTLRCRVANVPMKPKGFLLRREP